MHIRNLVTILILFVLTALPVLAYEDYSPTYAGTNVPVYRGNYGWGGGYYGGGYGGYWWTGPSLREMRRRENEDRAHGFLDYQIQQIRLELGRPGLSAERRARLERKLDQLLGVDDSGRSQSPSRRQLLQEQE